MSTTPIFLYIHFPFCVKKCLYCDFNSVADSPITPADYVAGLLREMELRAKTLTEPVTAPTLYFGGGTPSLMAPKEVGLIIDAAARLFGLAGSAEITIEANPGTVTQESLAGYRAAGVNRLSLGVQSFHDPFLERLGRVHTAADAITAVALARGAGFANIGIDLMNSLPDEDLPLWRRDLERAFALAPEHLSAYALSVEEGTPLHRLEQEGRLPLPEEDDSAAMLELTATYLGANGYEQYEIANFARPGFRSRHNQAYWRRNNYLGFGAGAHSFLRSPGFGRRWKNKDSPAACLESLRQATLPEEELSGLSARNAMGEFLYLGLRLLEGVDGERFRHEFGVAIEEVFSAEVEWLTANGLLERTDKILRLTQRALPVANQVFMRFV